MFKKIAVALAALSMVAATPAVAQGYDTYMRVENHSGVSDYIVSVKVQNVHGRVYEVLDAGYITPGYNRILDMGDGEGHGHCVYNAMVTFRSGTQAYRSGLDVCQYTTWKIYDLDNTLE